MINPKGTFRDAVQMEAPRPSLRGLILPPAPASPTPGDFVMLIAMSYSTELFLMVLFGTLTGHAAFNNPTAA